MENVRVSVAYRNVDGSRLPNGEAIVVAYHGEDIIGALRWDYYAEPPVVIDVSVEEEWRRMGVATRLFEVAKANESQLVHSDTLTPDGQSFIDSLA